MSKVDFAELNSVVNDVIKEEPYNHEDKVESTGNTDLNWEIKLEGDDYNLEDLHHVVDIKDEVPYETHNQEIEPLHNHQNQKSTKRKLSCSLSEEEIISVVSKKPTLWNTCHNNYECRNTLSIWQEVAQELGVSGEGLSCKAKWESIREQYKNFKQCVENRQHIKRWKYANRLSFLDPYLSFSQNLEDDKLAAPYMLSAAEQRLNPMSIPVNSTCSSPMNFEQKDVKIKLECLEVKDFIKEEPSIEVNNTAAQLQRVTYVAPTFINELGKQKDYHMKKFVLLERLAAAKEERAAVEERSTAAVERKIAAEERRNAAVQRKAAAEIRRAAAEVRRAAAEVRRVAVEVRKVAAGKRQAAHNHVEMRRMN